MTAAASAKLDQAKSVPFWMDVADKPERAPHLREEIEADLLVIGGGYTGLWTAILAKEQDPTRSVVLLEGQGVGHAASGRNGGFCSPSLTHGLSNGVERWPQEIDTLVRLGLENLAEIGRAIEHYGIDANFSMSGKVAFARTPWESDALEAAASEAAKHGETATFIPREQLASWTTSPEYVAGLHLPNYALVDPYKLVLGLRQVCIDLGVALFENTPVNSLNTRHRQNVIAVTPEGVVRARQIALATNAYKPLARRLSLATIPVYDFALVTEPLTDAQFSAIGWEASYGLTDAGNQFHYYRKTRDGRILWGGYDAIYHFGSARDEDRTQREETFDTLAENFYRTYPQLSDVSFTHKWGGLIDSSSQFCLTAGVFSRGRIAYAVGFTGLGVTATRFGAAVMLDLLAGRVTERTSLTMIRKPPMPFPPEPVRYWGVQLTRWSMARQDLTGKRNLWLRLMDALGLGFDS